jgi:hypothetical protein
MQRRLRSCGRASSNWRARPLAKLANSIVHGWSISQVARLRIASSLQPDLDKLAVLARGYADAIQDDVGGTRLERASVLAELDARLESSRLVQIRGLAGSGKSVLLKQCVQHALDCYGRRAPCRL